ncbi:hypothetical protein GW7_21446 [Heterocephalus glaber]|uniref:Small acidic protein-like domain-containing protein n=1 Tax=Heterocephalus glaber TaxID=10181 RepID=G5ANM8_HETGA|nr:hypothetical protein GW7_21446 [Heterocephalus glaber]
MKTNPKKKVEQPVVKELAQKSKKTRKKESMVAADPLKAPDTDLGLALGKKGNTDEAHTDQEQKLNFVKLMAGFKNRSPSFSRPPSMTARPNMALSKAVANTLQQNLQQDYDRTMS